MPASLTAIPTSGNITATKSFVAITVAGATENDTTAYSASTYPTSPEFRYYLRFELGGAELGRSYVFGVDDTGGHVFPNYVFPSAGAWTVRLRNAGTDASVATVALTVV